MGNTYSDIKNPFSSKQIPKHLKPINKKKKKKHIARTAIKGAPPAEAASPLAQPNDLFIMNQKGDKIVLNDKNSSPKIVINEDDDEFAEDESVLVGSGPRGAFRWFKGRRYLNYYAKHGGLEDNSSLLPNDQIELDRMRVQYFIIRWAFKGNVVAPVENQLKSGIKVLNVGFGPGMWAGHNIIDMAMDYRNSHFTTVDVCDLLPADFEEEAAGNDALINNNSNITTKSTTATNPAVVTVANNNNNDKLCQDNNSATTTSTITPRKPPVAAPTATTAVNNMTLFTPMHPNLSLKLQNTTTPVVDSSTLDSSSSGMLLSQIDEIGTQETYETISTLNTINDTEEEQQEASIGNNSNIADQLFIKQEQAPEDVTQEVKHRKLLANLDFYQVNVKDVKLPFEDNHFDFVKQRLVTASFTLTDWKRVISELVRVTKPGGYIQLLEIDYNTFNLGPNGRKWELQLLETSRLKRQLEPRMARYLPDILKAVGLIDVSSKLVSIPLGSWGLDLGNLWKHNMEMFVDSTCPLLSKLVGVSATEYRTRWRTMFEEVKDQKPFSNIHAAWGRKPLDGQVPSTIDWSSCPPLA